MEVVEKFSNEFEQEIFIQRGNPFLEKVDVILNGTNKHLIFRESEMIKYVSRRKFVCFKFKKKIDRRRNSKRSTINNFKKWTFKSR